MKPSPTAENIARITATYFGKQRQLYKEGKRGFGDLNKEFAATLYRALLPAYIQGLKSARAKKDLAYDGEAAAAKHALELAQILNRSTTRMLKNGRESSAVFGADRAALIALDADKRAKSTCLELAVESRGTKLQWVTKGPNSCKTCIKLNGRIAKPGKPFAIFNGEKIYRPALHPNCYCELQEVTS